MARALTTNVPTNLIANAVRPDVVQQISAASIDPYVTDNEMLQLLRTAYSEQVTAVLRLREELLGPNGSFHENALKEVGLTGSGRAVKVRGFRRALGRVLQNVPGFRWVKKAFEWGNIILGSLGSVPVVGMIADPIGELKESIETQGEDDQAGPNTL